MRSFSLPQGCVVFGLLTSALISPVAVRADRTFVPDNGKFLLTLQGTEIGSDTFTSDAEGGSTADCSLSLGGRKLALKLTVQATKGKFTRIAAEAQPGGKYELKLVNGKGTLIREGKLDSKPVVLPPGCQVFSNYAPHLFANAIAAYDLKKGGTQAIPIMAVDGLQPQGVITAKINITSIGAKPRQIGGKSVPLSRYIMTLPGAIGSVEMEVDTDKDNHVLLWDVHGQNFKGIRVGYESLALSDEPTDPTLSKATYAVKRETGVKIKMRDGIELVADVYRPDAEGQFPVILERTPYDRKNAFEASNYAKRGYVFVSQDVRGRYDSPGEWHPFVLEAPDGYDTVEWCGTQPWSSGKVGMIGGSYLGFVQWAAARENNPHLKCLIPQVSPPDPFFNIPYAFGNFYLMSDMWWATSVEGKTLQLKPIVKPMANYLTLPVTDVDKALVGHHIGFVQEWLLHNTNDAYYQQVNFNDKMKDIGPLPALNISGWFDGDGIGTKRNYAAMVASGHANQRVIYGPWTHAFNSSSKLGGVDFGPQSLRDLDTIYLRWFDHWLKGVDNGIEKEPPVEVFLLGANQWRRFSAWPPQEATLSKWYLHSGGKANGDKGDGTLSTDAPSAGEPSDHYAYDPAKPYIIPGMDAAAKAGSQIDTAEGSIPKDSERDPRLLVYTSPALTADLSVAGPIEMHLSAASSAKDTDWIAQLIDVYPDGRSFPLCRGILRARFRNSFEKPELLTPGKTYDYTLDLWAVGNVFKKGHKVRVTVSSSYFPLYGRNLNTGDNNETTTQTVVAGQTVYHNASHVSYIVLPTLR